MEKVSSKFHLLLQMTFASFFFICAVGWRHEQVTWQTLFSKFWYQNWDSRNFVLLGTKFGTWHILVPKFGTFTYFVSETWALHNIFWYLVPNFGAFTSFGTKIFLPLHILVPKLGFTYFGIWVLYIFWYQSRYLYMIWYEKLYLAYLLLSVDIIRKMFYLTW